MNIIVEPSIATLAYAANEASECTIKYYLLAGIRAIYTDCTFLSDGRKEKERKEKLKSYEDYNYQQELSKSEEAKKLQLGSIVTNDEIQEQIIQENYNDHIKQNECLAQVQNDQSVVVLYQEEQVKKFEERYDINQALISELSYCQYLSNQYFIESLYREARHRGEIINKRNKKRAIKKTEKTSKLLSKRR